MNKCFAKRHADGTLLGDEGKDDERLGSNLCLRCGWEGHSVRECYAKRDVHGNWLPLGWVWHDDKLRRNTRNGPVAVKRMTIDASDADDLATGHETAMRERMLMGIYCEHIGEDFLRFFFLAPFRSAGV